MLGSMFPNRAYKFSTFSIPSPKSILSQLKPNGSKYDIIISKEPSDFGVILLHWINSEVNSIGLTISDINRLN